MQNLIRKLDELEPGWRESISSDPVEAAIELSIIEPEDCDEGYRPLEFND